MKKITGILGVAVIALAIFFSANGSKSSTSDTSLASLMSLNVANAQTESTTGYVYTGRSEAEVEETREVWIIVKGGVEVVYSTSIEGGIKTTRKIKYKCCQVGGQNCPTQLRLC